MSITEIYNQKCQENSDIFQHLPVLKKYAENCVSIVELGVRSIVSTWAFLAAKPKRLISIDINHPSYYSDYDPNGCNLELVETLAEKENIKFIFWQADTLSIIIYPCDMIFFDTLHTYDQLSQELKYHGNKAKRYLAFHDTVSYGIELLPAIDEFIAANPYWVEVENLINNNGLIVLERQ